MNILFISFMIFYVIFAVIFLLVPYVLRALALYTLAKNKNIDVAWLAWIPLADSYIVGLLSKGSPFMRKKFPNIHIILPSLYGLYAIVYIGYMIYFFTQFPMFNPSFAYNMFGSIMFIIFYIAFMLFALFVSASYYFTLYHVYKSYDPNNTALYTVLSILFKLGFVFLFVIRKKDPAFADEEVSQELPPAQDNF